MAAAPGLVVDAALAAARAAWPDIIFDAAALRQSLLAIATAADDPHQAIAALCVDDLYLAQACARGDAAAIARFDAEHLARVPAYLARHGARADADELRQQLRERLLVARGAEPPRIAAYAGRGSLASWVRVAAVRAASNARRAERPHDELADEVPAAALTEVPELRVMAGSYRAAFRAAFRTAFAALPVEDRTALRLHFLDGVTVRRLAPILGVSTATAGRRLLAAQHRLSEAVLAELAAAIDTPVAELESAVRAIVSRLDVSLSAMQL